MSTPRKTITVTEQQDERIKKQINAGRYTSDSEYIRDLLGMDQQINSYNDAIPKALVKGEQSRVVKTLNANERKQRMAAKHG